MYQNHCENLIEIEEAIKIVEFDLRRYISTGKDNSAHRYTMLLAYLLPCWSEVRVLKLAYEYGFSPADTQSIKSERTLEKKWKRALDISICKAYAINIMLDIPTQLQPIPKSRYLEIVNLIDTKLVPSITIRNRVAHGQWKHVFSSNLNALSPLLTAELHSENIVKLQLQKKLVKVLAQLIHDLAVSPITFERDFDKSYGLIDEIIRNLLNRDYATYKLKMVAKYQRGQVKRSDNELNNNKLIKKLQKKEKFLARVLIAALTLISLLIITEYILN